MFKEILLRVINVLDSCHVEGREAKKYGDAVEALRDVIKIIENVEGEVKNNENHDKQGENA